MVGISKVLADIFLLNYTIAKFNMVILYVRYINTLDKTEQPCVCVNIYYSNLK